MFGFFDKNILDGISQGVVIENIVLEVNEPGRFLQFLDEGIEFALSIGKNFYLIPCEKFGSPQSITELDLLLAFG